MEDNYKLAETLILGLYWIICRSKQSLPAETGLDRKGDERKGANARWEIQAHDINSRKAIQEDQGIDFGRFIAFLKRKRAKYYKNNPHLLLKSTSGKVLREVTVHGAKGDYQAGRWFKLEDVEYQNTFDETTKTNWGKTELASLNIFGKRLTKESLARLGGSFSDEKISIEPIGTDVIKITVEGEHHTSVRKISKEGNKIYISLNKTRGHRFENKKMIGDVNATKGKGIAVNSIYTMIKEGQKVGVTYLKGDFIRTKNGHDGYFKYARLGFDGNIVGGKLHGMKVQNYIEMENKNESGSGLRKWKENGTGFEGTLYLSKEKDYDRFIKYFNSLIYQENS